MAGRPGAALLLGLRRGAPRALLPRGAVSPRTVPMLTMSVCVCHVRAFTRDRKHGHTAQPDSVTDVAKGRARGTHTHTHTSTPPPPSLVMNKRLCQLLSPLHANRPLPRVRAIIPANRRKAGKDKSRRVGRMGVWANG